MSRKKQRIRVGDDVLITSPPHDGRTGRVVGIQGASISVRMDDSLTGKNTVLSFLPSSLERISPPKQGIAMSVINNLR